jgi:DNA-binding transcriptional LysR family regulator
MSRMNFDLTELQAFVAVADRQSFHLAAEALHLSQPALSRRIDKLEAALGTPLLARTTRRVSLTATGRDFLVPARTALSGLEDAVLRLAGSTALRHGRVGLACIPSFAAQVLPPILGQFSARFPGVRVHLIDDSASAVLAAVTGGQADLGIDFVGAQEADVQFTPLGREPYVLVLARTHAWARRRQVRWAELAGQRMVAVSRRSGNRVLIDHALAQLAERPVAFHEAEHVAGALALVDAGLGMAVLPRLGLPAQHATLTAVRLVEPHVERALGLITSTVRPLPPAASALHDLVRAALPGRWLAPM